MLPKIPRTLDHQLKQKIVVLSKRKAVPLTLNSSQKPTAICVLRLQLEPRRGENARVPIHIVHSELNRQPRRPPDVGIKGEEGTYADLARPGCGICAVVACSHAARHSNAKPQSKERARTHIEQKMEKKGIFSSGRSSKIW